MNVDCDVEIRVLIEKYKLNSLNKNFSLISIITEIIDRIDCKTRVGIWGGGEHTEQLLNTYNFNEKNVICIIDNDCSLYNKKKYGYLVVEPQKANECKLDVIIVSSFASKMQIVEEKDTLLPECKHIDFYAELEKKGIELAGPFYSNCYNYIKLYKIKEEYIREENILLKQKHLWELISEYLEIRDFCFALEFIDKYIEEKYSGYEKLRQFKKELYILFEDIKNRMKLRNTNDISMFLLDALRAKDVYENKIKMPYLRSISDESVVFTKAISSSAFTYESLSSMFTGKDVLDDGLYKSKLMNFDDSEFFTKAYNQGYIINLLSSDSWKNIEDGRVNSKNNYEYASKLCWDLICMLCKNIDKPMISNLHFSNETHPPHICGYHKMQPHVHLAEYSGDLDFNKISYTQMDFINQYEESLNYIDKQLQFFLEMLPENMIKIIYSDHGQSIEKAVSSTKEIGPNWREERIHVAFIINSCKFESLKYDKLFSMKNFSELLSKLIDGKLEIPKYQYAEIQLGAIYNKKIIDRFIDCDYNEWTMAFKAIRTENTKYVLTSNGAERYYILPNEETNNIDDDRYQEDIMNIKKNIKCEFPNICD
ncbi:sulfatase-like hydrolase/transferase [Clostridium sp. FP1]|uniref:sulfatase-like hydrolase/transferase n=1 Tax=Clostridium sp. FP1 TaxID=2724076 RepID=UPI0013E97B01|nr:sulfatase-like hydrolase/transferase [Clostridium sp. FP1]MBZ9636012.1 LTA synthase family protein [Clostridium sp. FP1]